MWNGQVISVRVIISGVIEAIAEKQRLSKISMSHYES